MIPHRAFYPYGLFETLLKVLTLSALLVSLLMALLDSTLSDAELLQRVEAQVQQDFLAHLEQVSATPPQLRVSAAPSPSREDALPSTVHLKLSPTGELLAWSSQEFVPNPNVIAAQLLEPNDELLVNNQYIYYNQKTFTDTAVFFSLTPLKVDYPIKNQFLHDFIYLGRYNAQVFTRELPIRSFSMRPIRPDRNPGINVYDANGRHLYGVQLSDTLPFRTPHRSVVTIFVLLALVFGLGWLFLLLRRSFRRQWQRELVFTSVLVACRVLLLVMHLPAGYLPNEFFSPALLAIDRYSPSLGDLTLNTLVLLVIVLRMYLLLAPHTATIASRFHSRFGWWVFQFASIGVAVVLFSLFFQFFELLALNSKAQFEFADPYQLNGYSLLLFLNIGLVLLTFFLVLHFLLGVAQSIPLPEKQNWQYLLVLALGVLLLGLQGVYDAVYLATFAGFVLLLFVLRLRVGISLRFSLINALLLIAGLAAITNFAITRSLKARTHADLVYYAKKFANQQDWLTEYIFDEVARTIAADQSLWLPSSRTVYDTTRVLHELPNRIINQYLASSFQGYDYYVTFQDSSGNQRDGQPAPPPLSEVPTGARGKTLSPNLWYINSQANSPKHFYVGQFQVPTTMVGPLRVQVSLTPKTALGGQLYPRLLVDQSIRQKMSIPQAFPMALFTNRRQERHVGSFSFPTYLREQPPVGESRWEEKDGRYFLWLRLDADRTVMATANGRNLFDRITAFSFLFYFFVLLYGVYSVPLVLEKAAMVGFTPYARSFAFRIQFFMALVSIVPLLVLWFLISPRFSSLYLEDAQDELKQGLQQVADYVTGDQAYLRKINQKNPSLAVTSNELINSASNLLSTDLNVFNLRGHLEGTSRPKIYQVELCSPYMNPIAYRTLASGEESEVVLMEQIGGMEYLSGYKALIAPSGEVVGFLNLPWLSKQGLLESQVRSFAAYLVNLYVIIMIGVIVGGFFLSKSLTSPLRLLKQKLDQINLGMPYEELDWQSKDEIGAIIASYNQMLHKLERQEQKLAQTERELAWREMARQVAHEIKNPLTPMKLSIQHLMRMLQRMGNHNDPAMRKVTDTLLTQIDSLNSIASSFSMFATMPQERHALVELQPVVEQVCELHLDAAEAEISWEIPESPLYIHGDRNQLTRVLINLIRNALQAMENRGNINIRLYEEGTRATVSISDNGRGIPIPIQMKIFEPNFSTKTSGMGLGLAITKRLVENMEGTITFESEVGVGTTFYVSFPIILPEPEAPVELQL